MTFSIAEVFLLVWAIGATVLCAVILRVLKLAILKEKVVSNLVAEVASGEVKPTYQDGIWTVENDDIRMQFAKRKG